MASQALEYLPEPTSNRLARGLGWFSIGLGLTELISPQTIARITGTRNHSSLIRAYGLREIAAGIGILASQRPAPWLWARVAGDAVDLATLGKAAGGRKNNRGKTIFSIASVAGVTALDVACAGKLTKADTAAGPAWMHAEANMVVSCTPEECYRYWRNFENLPRFMSYIESVTDRGQGSSHWVAKGPGDTRVEWEAELEQDIPGQTIAWRSREGSDVWTEGTVNFEPATGGRGTIIRVQMDYGHAFQALQPLATLLGKDPEQMIHKELRRFKQIMETGEVITTEGQPSGRDSGVTWLDKVAR